MKNNDKIKELELRIEFLEKILKNPGINTPYITLPYPQCPSIPYPGQPWTITCTTGTN